MSQLSSSSINSSNKSDLVAYALLSGIFILRLIYVSFMGIVPDEAYYWDWSRNPAFGYFDHPPMVAWLIFLGARIFGTTFLGVKFMAVAGSFFASLCTYYLAKKYVQKTSSLIILILLSSFVILFGVGGLIATPDIPMVLFWSIGLLVAHAFIFDNRRWTWLLLGAVMGCGMLSKYLFGLFIVSLLVFLLYSKEHRRLLFSKRLWGALLVAFIFFLPNLLWNSRHQWVSVMYQMHHGLGAREFPHFDFLGEFIGGQIGVLSIFPFFLLVIAVINEMRFHLNNPRRMFIAAFFILPLAFFTFSSLQKRVEPNWPCAAYVSGLILVALLWEEAGLKKVFLRRFILFSTIISCAATAVVLIHVQTPVLPLPPGKDPTAQIRGWKPWAAAIDSVRAKVDPAESMPLCTKFYQDAAFLAFYLPDHPGARALRVNSRPTQYSLYEADAGLRGKKVIIVLPGQDSLPPEFAQRVDGVVKAATVFQSPGRHTHNPYGVFTAVLKTTP